MKKILFLLVSALVAFAANATIYVTGNGVNGPQGAGNWPDEAHVLKVDLKNGYYHFQTNGGTQIKISEACGSSWDNFNQSGWEPDGSWSNDKLTIKKNWGNDINLPSGKPYVRVSLTDKTVEVSATQWSTETGGSITPEPEPQGDTFVAGNIYYVDFKNVTWVLNKSSNKYPIFKIEDGTSSAYGEVVKDEDGAKIVKFTAPSNASTFQFNRCDPDNESTVWNWMKFNAPTDASNIYTVSDFKDKNAEGSTGTWSTYEDYDVEVTPMYVLSAGFNNFTKDVAWALTLQDNGTYYLKKDFGEDGCSTTDANLGVRYFVDMTKENSTWYASDNDNNKSYTEADMAEGKDYILKVNGSNITYPQLFGEVEFTLTVGSDGKPAKLNIKGGAKEVIIPEVNYSYNIYGELDTKSTWQAYALDATTLSFSKNFNKLGEAREFGIQVCDENGQLKEGNDNKKGWYFSGFSAVDDYTYVPSTEGTSYDLVCELGSTGGHNFALPKNLTGEVTFTVTIDETTKLPVSILIAGGSVENDPQPANKTLYLVYKNANAESWSVMDPTMKDGKFTFAMPVTNNHEVRFKFVTNKSCDFETKNTELFAPSSAKAFINDAANVNVGGSYWKDLPNGNGVFNITAEFTNTDQTAMKFTTVPNVTIVSAGDFYYKLGDADWVKVPNRVVVEGEYVQWNVTIKANQQDLKFKFGNDVYSWGGDNGYWLNNVSRYRFKKLEKIDNRFYFNNEVKYQFIIRKFDDQENYDLAIRRVADADFQVYTFGLTEDHPDTFSREGLGITDFLEGKAGQSFSAVMDFKDNNMNATPDNKTSGETVLHWVKYEHPFWGYASAALMEYTGEGDLSVAEALYKSDSYLYPEDPRVKLYFDDDMIADLTNGNRNWSVDNAKDESFKPQSAPHINDATPHQTDRTFYRVYMTMEQQHGAATEMPNNSPQRAAVNSEFAGQWGSRVAYTAELPADAGNITVTGIEEVKAEADMFTGEAEYFTISGVRVYGEPAPGLYIVRRGNQVTKELVK